MSGFTVPGQVPPEGFVQQPDHRMVRFERTTRLNPTKSRKEGRPIYESIDVLKVHHPGERDETAVRVQEHHKYEFPRQWAAFEAGMQVDLTGTPLSLLFPDAPHVVAHMKTLQVHTVEQLAGLTEEGIRRLGMGGREYQQRAQAYVEMAERGAPAAAMEEKLRQRDEKIAELEAQVQMLIEAATKPRRGKRVNAAEMDEGDDA